jgi:hypothetical protein
MSIIVTATPKAQIPAAPQSGENTGITFPSYWNEQI